MATVDPAHSPSKRKRVELRLDAEERVIVFSRYPVAGNTKTRLIPAVGAHGAAHLQTHLTESLLKKLSTWHTAAEPCCAPLVELRYHGGSEDDVRTWLHKTLDADGLLLREQLQQGDLGAKMAQAFAAAFADGAQRVCVVGCDIPLLGADEVSAAFSALRGSDKSGGCTKMALGPAADGGYYLVALSREIWSSSSRVQDGHTIGQEALSALFDGADISWGGPQVRQQQLQKARAADLDPWLVPTTLCDIDEAEELDAAEECLPFGADELRAVTLSAVGISIEKMELALTCAPDVATDGMAPLRRLLVDHGGMSCNVALTSESGPRILAAMKKGIK